MAIIFTGILLPFCLKMFILPTAKMIIFRGSFLPEYLIYIICYIAIGDYIGRKFEGKKILHSLISVFLIYSLYIVPAIFYPSLPGNTVFKTLIITFKGYPFLYFVLLIIPGALFYENLKSGKITGLIKYTGVFLWILIIILYGILVFKDFKVAFLIIFFLLALLSSSRIYSLLIKKNKSTMVEVFISLTLNMLALSNICTLIIN